jgi:protein-disulfide isomerase
VYGDPAAPVTVTEYLDFQCPVCLRAGLTVLLAIEKTYVETGKAKLEIKPIAILGDESVAAAAAAQCATDQGRFWPYHDILFANQGAENDGGFNYSRLKDFAIRVGLDSAAFNSCVDAKTYETQVKADTQASKSVGVKGTPTIFVDGTKVETSIDAISTAIEAGLSGG